MRALALWLILATALLAQGMFDLFPGTWSGDLQDYDYDFTLFIGPPEVKTMSWSVGDQTVKGTYKVTSAKRPTFGTFMIDEGPEITLSGLHLKPGAEVRFGLDSSDSNAVTMDIFNPDNVPVVHLVLKQ